MRIYWRKLKLLSTSLLLSATLIVFALFNEGIAFAQVAPTDEDVADAVAAELEHSDLVSYDRVLLSVDDGIVVLAGSVGSITAQRKIEEVAATVRGVRAIVNRVEIDTEPIESKGLRSRIDNSLKGNSATDLYQLNVIASDDGAVTLEGLVDSWAEYELAETVVGSVDGVKSIDNQITVDAATHHRGAGEIESDITERLRWDARVDDSLIAVLVRDGGRVTLSGTVGSLAEKRLATSLAHVSGVRAVDAAHLDVESWARDEDRILGADNNVADQAVKDAVERALLLDPRVASIDIDVTVTNGEVWLRGMVQNIMASRAAGGAARNTFGIRHVHNLLNVAPADMDDAAIARHITDVLAMSDSFDESEIDVSVNEGHATVSGDVDRAEQFRRIDEILANTRGVEAVTNNLTVRGERPRVAVNPFMSASRLLLPMDRPEKQSLSDRSLHSAVESELFWSPFVDENAVAIDVDEGHVTLTGVVDSMNESIAAAENAFEAGALVVDNKLEVE